MEDQSSTQPQTKEQKCQCLKKVSNFITNSLEQGFYRLGKLVGSSPWITILITLLVCAACAVGLLNFTQENRGDKLWTPQDSIAQKQKEWVDNNFPAEVRVSNVLLVGKNVLEPSSLKEALKIHQDVKQIGNGTDNSWEKLCFRIGPYCFATGLLELWSFNETAINQLTKEDILKKINQKTLISPVTGRQIDVSQYIGGIERNSSNDIVSAEATTMSYGIKFNPELNPSAGQLEDKVVTDWEEKFNTLMDGLDVPSMELFYFTLTQYGEDAGGSIQSDVRLLSIGYVLIIAYVAIMLGKFTRLNIKAWLALLGVICIGLAIGVSFGLSSAFGVFYGPVHSTLPFLLLGIGVDDMFVIVQAWSNLPPDIHTNHPIPERIGLALKHAGCSITITSLTDFLAFLIGATTILPALRSFCIFAGIGILADFILQATLFTAFLTLDARRQEKKRDGCCCCCIRLPDNYSETTCGKRDLFQEFMDKFFAPVILSLPGKIVVIVMTAALFGVNLYGTLMLKQYFDPVLFLPPDTMGYKYTITNSKYFPVAGAPADIYTGTFDYYKEQGNLHKLTDVALNDKYIVSTSVNSWFEKYIEWAMVKKPAEYFNIKNVNNETLFYLWLEEFLQSSGFSYRKDVRTKNSTGRLPEITASRFTLRHVDMDNTQTEVKAMEDLRDKVEAIFPDDRAFPYSLFYLGWETNKVISEELFRNMGLALVTVFVVTLIILANLWTCLLVFTCVGFTLVNITGTMHFWGLTIDTVTTIILVLAVGLSVDYASHIGHTFMVISGTRYERARATLRDIGPAVWNGGLSTFLAIVLLAFSNSYVFMTFFKVFFCVVFYGLFHGLCYLPVLLCTVGPSAYESAQPKDQKCERNSPVHPGEEPGDNTSYELAVSRGRKSPFKNGTAPKMNGIQKESYKLPPVDYEDLDISKLDATARVNAGFRSSTDANLDKAL